MNFVEIDIHHVIIEVAEEEVVHADLEVETGVGCHGGGDGGMNWSGGLCRYFGGGGEERASIFVVV